MALKNLHQLVCVFCSSSKRTKESVQKIFRRNLVDRDSAAPNVTLKVVAVLLGEPATPVHDTGNNDDP